MSSKSAADMLASTLGIDNELAQRHLDAFSGGLIAELLLNGNVRVDGLGTFTVKHNHAARQHTVDGTLFTPPHNTVVFDAIQPGMADASRIVTGRMGHAPDEAGRLVLALASTFSRCREESRLMELNGFGSFSRHEDGTFRFTPDSAFDELINSAYEGLRPIMMQATGEGVKEQRPVFKIRIAATLALLLLLVLSGYYLYRTGFSFFPGSDEQSAPDLASPKPQPSGKEVETASGNSVQEPAGITTQPDSLLLARGRFTVIAGTFQSRKTVDREIRRLSEAGHRMMIWPVYGKGKRYFRLVTGDFESRRAALDSLRKMPPGLPRHSYIQQAPKDVVLYGEQGV